LLHIESVLQKLESAGLTANPRKCVCGGKHIEFLGHLVGGGKMSLPGHRAEAFKKYTLPTTKRGLRSFLGAVRFYRHYIRQLASETAKLTPLTAKLAPSKVVWSREGELAFKTIVQMICNTSELCIPMPEDTYSLVRNASGLGIGGVLQVQRDEHWEAAAFHSRQLRGAEQRYSATELEALAMVSCVEHFAYYLYRHAFTIFTDHKPLTHLLGSDKLNPRLRRLGYIRVEYLPGQDNGFADALSREERRSVTHTRRERESQETGDSSRKGGCGGTTPTTLNTLNVAS